MSAFDMPDRGAAALPSSRTKILIVSMMAPLGPTGVQTHVRAAKDVFEKLGFEVKLVTPFFDRSLIFFGLLSVRRIIEQFSPSLAVRLYRYGHGRRLRDALKKELENSNERSRTIFYTQCPVSAGAALEVAVKPYHQVVLVVHFNISQADEWVEKGSIKAGGALYANIKLFEETVIPRVDSLIFVSAFMRQTMLSRIPSLKDLRSTVVPNFLPDSGLHASPAGQMRDLLCIGTLEPRKNQRYAIAVIAAAKAAGSTLTLTIVGSGPDRTKLEKLADLLNVREQIAFSGYVPDAANLFFLHRACIHVATMESFGIVLIESLARGKPVFAVGAGGVPEVFSDGVEGRFLPRSDAHRAAAMICEWIDNPEVLVDAGQKARLRYLERYDSNVVGQQFASFLDDGWGS